MKAESSSHGQLVAHNKKTFRDAFRVSTPSIWRNSSVFILRAESSSPAFRLRHKLSTSSMKITFKSSKSQLQCVLVLLRCTLKQLSNEPANISRQLPSDGVGELAH
eukprot:m.208243 g.208243  ORF g.208243 m.208243 type:complete len:106 (-) comp15038_c2_seq16:1334-1651(-)